MSLFQDSAIIYPSVWRHLYLEDVEKKLETIQNISWRILSTDIYAIHILEKRKNWGKLNWKLLCQNENAVFILSKKENLSKICYDILSSNINAIHLIENELDRIGWYDETDEITCRRLNRRNDGSFYHKSEYRSSPFIPILSTYLTISNDNDNHNDYTIQEYKRLKNHCNRIDWKILSTNINAIHIIERNLDIREIWYNLSKNVNAISILEKNINKINWDHLVKNKNAISILEKNVDKLDKYHWEYLSQNADSISFLENNLDKINWPNLCFNRNAIPILKKNMSKIDWNHLSYNCNAISILEQNMHKINWCSLSKNSNAISILEKNIDKIHWNVLLKNDNALPILQNNVHRIDWYEVPYDSYHLWKIHPRYKKNSYIPVFPIEPIYEINYLLLKGKMDIIREELMMKLFHPKRLAKYLEVGYDIFDGL